MAVPIGTLQRTGKISDLLSYFVAETGELEAYCRWLQIRVEDLIKNKNT
jgi:hypothetical protein